MFTDAPSHLLISRRRALGFLASGAAFALAGVRLSAEERLKGEALRKAFVRRFDRPRVPLAPQSGVVETKEGIIYEKWTIASEAGQRVPLLIARGEGSSGRRPAVVGLHGLGGRKESMFPSLDGLVRRGCEAEITAKVVAETWRRWLPGIPHDYDCQDLLAAFAPRPLLVINGDSDPVAPLDGVKEAWSVIESAYRNAGSAQNARLFVAEKSGHTITTAQREAILDWFSNHLRG